MADDGVNNSTCYRFLKASGMNQSADAREVLQKQLNAYAKKLVDAAAQRATEDKRKTIQAKDFDSEEESAVNEG